MTPSRQETWRQIRKEMQSVGITPRIFNNNKPIILSALRGLVSREDLEDIADETLEEDEEMSDAFGVENTTAEDEQIHQDLTPGPSYGQPTTNRYYRFDHPMPTVEEVEEDCDFVVSPSRNVETLHSVNTFREPIMSDSGLWERSTFQAYSRPLYTEQAWQGVMSLEGALTKDQLAGGWRVPPGCYN
jgi:hypothetical protein